MTFQYFNTDDVLTHTSYCFVNKSNQKPYFIFSKVSKKWINFNLG